MKHLKIFEDFSNHEINEGKETPLPGGFVNLNTDDTNAEEGTTHKKGVIYFSTNTTTPDKNLGTPNTLDVSVQEGDRSTTLTFASDSFRDEDRTINMTSRDYKKLAASPGSSTLDKPSVLAKNPAEATAKAYEILANATYLTKSPADPKVVGDMIRAFFEIRKLYPAYMSKNALFKGFLQGIINGFSNPNFGEFARSEDWSYNIKDGKYKEEIRKALTDAGVIKASS